MSIKLLTREMLDDFAAEVARTRVYLAMCPAMLWERKRELNYKWQGFVKLRGHLPLEILDVSHLTSSEIFPKYGESVQVV